MQGSSMWPLLSGDSATVHGDDFVMGWELFGRRAIRRGDWKLVWTPEPYGASDWELFQIAADPAELNDLAAEQPERKAMLIELWDAYARNNGVVWVDQPMAY
jgi:arylsulfatase